MSSSFQEFELVVRNVWPSYRANVQPIWDRKLRSYAFDRLIDVLNEHRANNPDEVKPIWKMIYHDLSGGNAAGAGSKSDLRILLDQVRRVIAEDSEWMKRKPIDAWTDADVWQNFLDAQTFPTTHEMIAGGYRLREDPNGKIAERAARKRAIQQRRYESDLRERGEQIPEWLFW